MYYLVLSLGDFLCDAPLPHRSDKKFSLGANVGGRFVVLGGGELRQLNEFRELRKFCVTLRLNPSLNTKLLKFPKLSIIANKKAFPLGKA